jgi:hypothetical protein
MCNKTINTVWVDNIKMDPREMGWVSMDRINLAQDRDRWRALVNTVMNLQVPETPQEGLSSMRLVT